MKKQLIYKKTREDVLTKHFATELNIYKYKLALAKKDKKDEKNDYHLYINFDV